MTGRSAQTCGAISRTDRPRIAYTKSRKPANLGYVRDLTHIYRTLAPTPVVVVVRMKCRNDGAVGANIFTYYNGQYIDEHGHYDAQPVHFAKST